MPGATAIRVLVIEDDPAIRRFLRAALEAEGILVLEADTGRRGLVEAGNRKPDLLIVDLGLPDLDGLEVIRGVRGWSAVPIVVVSARSQEAEKVAALDLGADDYLTKPFGLAELLARIRAHLRRRDLPQEGVDQKLRLGDTVIDLAHHSVLRGGEPVNLTPIEYRLLSVLVRNRGKVLTHRHLLHEVWGPGHADSSHYLRIYMGHLRRKLERDPAQPDYLITETGVGYRLITGG